MKIIWLMCWEVFVLLTRSQSWSALMTTFLVSQAVRTVSKHLILHTHGQSMNISWSGACLQIIFNIVVMNECRPRIVLFSKRILTEKWDTIMRRLNMSEREDSFYILTMNQWSAGFRESDVSRSSSTPVCSRCWVSRMWLLSQIICIWNDLLFLSVTWLSLFV